MKEISKSWKYFLARLARSCTKSCKYCTKNEAFLARYIKSCNLARILQEKCKVIFLQDLIKLLQENYLANFSFKTLARFFISCKKSFIFSARLARFSARSCSLARRILARFGYLLQDGFYSVWLFCSQIISMFFRLTRNFHIMYKYVRKTNFLCSNN